MDDQALNDQALIEQCRDRDDRAWKEVKRLHEQKLLTAVLRKVRGRQHVAEEIIQETYLELLNSTQPIEKLGPWLMGVARNKAKDEWKKYLVWQCLVDDMEAVAPRGTTPVGGPDLDFQELADVEVLSEALSAAQRETLMQAAQDDDEGIQRQQRDAVLGLRPGTFGRRVNRTRMKALDAFRLYQLCTYELSDCVKPRQLLAEARQATGVAPSGKELRTFFAKTAEHVRICDSCKEAVAGMPKYRIGKKKRYAISLLPLLLPDLIVRWWKNCAAQWVGSTGQLRQPRRQAIRRRRALWWAGAVFMVVFLSVAGLRSSAGPHQAAHASSLPGAISRQGSDRVRTESAGSPAQHPAPTPPVPNAHARSENKRQSNRNRRASLPPNDTRTPVSQEKGPSPLPTASLSASPRPNVRPDDNASDKPSPEGSKSAPDSSPIDTLGPKITLDYLSASTVGQQVVWDGATLSTCGPAGTPATFSAHVRIIDPSGIEHAEMYVDHPTSGRTVVPAEAETIGDTFYFQAPAYKAPSQLYDKRIMVIRVAATDTVGNRTEAVVAHVMRYDCEGGG
ncbi:RNA polymerase sigma factor [Streptomyces triticiradicis]|uniref:RNA polymerase sigma-70 region 2 domain-containing protein n=1 Tax=Streptomyces triticiradicis TaxID=2651189 RepID=A0A7J5DEY0_9ACTN|nr:sigma-70 family RNA polymerase sigma factor [Streptomyces triticiradicis]KAB1987431.1 hypothetical protein F8144_16995 [Streptomyces triticiradicis]